MRHPLISIVMPAFNAGKYIRESINSVLNQSFDNWELIIVDDASTDNTYYIAREYAEKDDRITLFRLSENSGTVQIPRNKAISLAKGNWILGLDSDDYIEERDLEKLYNRAVTTNAEIVLHRIVSVNENGTPIGDSIPSHDFSMDTVLTGKEACMKTIGRWEINGNGIFRKELYQKLFDNREVTTVNSDEYDTRFLLLHASKVVFSDSEYYYRQNSNSITRCISYERFDVLTVDHDLELLIGEMYGTNSQEYLRMVNQRFNNLIALTRLYKQNEKKIPMEHRERIVELLKCSYYEIDKKKICPTSFIKKILFDSGWKIFCFIVMAYFKIRKA